ncbi:MAG: hypothetical protein JWN70_5432 [Planctomycetaceae bacterium]|nr:hypothetical protein [Planctomycetaceae bacterium]
MDAESAARWSAWPAVVCYVAAWALSLRPADNRSRIWIRLLWTAGWLALVAHVIVALAFVHGWSWSAAYEHTAQRTQTLVGWNWGGGVWFNLLTVGVWGADVLRMWMTSSRPERSVPAADWTRWSNYAVQSYIAFMMINATVVFGSLFAQFTGCLMCAGLAMYAWQQHCNTRG